MLNIEGNSPVSAGTINTNDGARFWGLIGIRRVTAGSQSPGIGRLYGVTKGHQPGRFRIREDDGGACRTLEDTAPARFGTVRHHRSEPDWIFVALLAIQGWI